MSSSKKSGLSTKRTPVPVKYGPPSAQAVDQFFQPRRRPAKRKASPSEKENVNQPSTSSLSSTSGSTSGFNSDTAKSVRLCPLPPLQWADREEVWANMIKREKKHRLDPTILEKHTDISPRMRAVLIDWLIEVSEVYTLHRETLYMAVAYVDRYLARQATSIRKCELQLIGVSALFFAAKLEEIYPPKLAEFAYVTDSACTEVEMREMELMMLKKLQWELSPPTAISWLNLYLQAAQLPINTEFHLPLYPKGTFVQIAQLLDLCLMDIGSLKFLPSVIAAACLYHFSSEELALQCSGYTLRDISAAIRWVTPFAMTIRDQGLASLRSFRKVKPDDAHNIQTHINTIQCLEKVQARQAQALTTACYSSGESTPNVLKLDSIGTPVTPITPADVSEYLTPERRMTPHSNLTPQSEERPSPGQAKRSRASPPSDSSSTLEANSDDEKTAPISESEPILESESDNIDIHSGALWNTSPFGDPSGATSELRTDDLDNGTDNIENLVSTDPLDNIDNHLSSSRDGLTGSGSPSSNVTITSSPGGSSTLESPNHLNTSSLLD